MTSPGEIGAIFAAKAAIITAWLMLKPRLFRKRDRQEPRRRTEWGGELRKLLPGPDHARRPAE